MRRHASTSSLDLRIAKLARQPATAISLRDLYKAGHKPSRSVRLQNALFLQRELPIRMAQRIVELKSLPFGLHRSTNILTVIDWYTSFFNTLASMPKLETCEDEHRFTEVIETQLQTPSLVAVMLSAAVSQAGASVEDPGGRHYGGDGGSSGGVTRQQTVDYMQSALDRFFTARIGLRFLMEHHIRSFRVQEEGWSGIIRANFDPTEVIRQASDDATQLCEVGSARPPSPHLPLTRPRGLMDKAGLLIH